MQTTMKTIAERTKNNIKFKALAGQGKPSVSTQNHYGFTYIEIIVVIVVMGIMASIAFSSLDKWVPNYKLKAAAEELYASMQSAKSMAVKSNRNVGMEFFPVGCPPDGGTYRLFIDDGAGAGTSKDDQMTGSEQPFLSVTMSDGVCLSSTTWANNRGGFTSQGVASATGGPGSVTLKHIKTGRTYTVSQLISGGIRMQ